MLARKRQELWLNGARNDFVAIWAADMACRTGRFVHMASECEEQLHGGPTILLVESPEHGRRLQGRLQWPLTMWNPSSETRFRTGEAGGGIVTAAALEDLRWADPSILINATGADWVVMPAAWEHLTPALRLVLEIADDFDRQAEQATRRRLWKWQIRSCQLNVPQRWRA